MRIDWNDKKIITIMVVGCIVMLLVVGVVFWRVAYCESEESSEVITTGDIGEEAILSDSQETDSDSEEEGNNGGLENLEENTVGLMWKTLSSEIEQPATGIDVSQFQGGIDWGAVQETAVTFAMIRIGNRNSVSGEIEEDECARYNLQEATANGIMVGAYFVSTAITEAEVLEEVTFLCDILDGYGITYPVVYDCEGFQSEEHRQYDLTKEERTALAMCFLEEVEKRGYVGMFYASSSDIEYDMNWVTSELEVRYRMWVAQYKIDDAIDIEELEKPEYDHEYVMWQYTQNGEVNGITEPVDMNTSYFTCSEIADPITPGTAVEVALHPEVGVNFQEVNEEVTPKEEVNVRSTMEQGDDSNVIGALTNGVVVTRTGIGINGWSRIIYNGESAYVVSNYVTTDLSYKPEEDSNFKTVFTEVYEEVTAKDVTNLRDMPSVETPSQVIHKLKSGEVVIRTGTSNEGWSRVEYNDQELYCISSYLKTVD